jgi:hypothetical protein
MGPRKKSAREFLSLAAHSSNSGFESVQKLRKCQSQFVLVFLVRNDDALVKIF